MKLAVALMLLASGNAVCAAGDGPPAADQVVGSAVVGAVTSTAAILIDNTSMSPMAAPSWPVVDHDEIQASTASAFFVTPEQNRVVLDPGTVVKTSRVEAGELFIYLSKGRVSFQVRSRRLFVCAGGRLLVAKTAAAGWVRLNSSGGASEHLDAGEFDDKEKRGCGDQGLLTLAGAAVAPTSAAVAPGATGAAVGGATGAATGGIGAIAAGAGAAAAAGGVSAFAATSSSSPCPAAGCNFNPAPVTVITQ